MAVAHECRCGPDANCPLCSTGLRVWLRDNASDVVTVLELLMRSPAEFGALLTIARLETEGADLTYQPGSDVGRDRYDAERERVAAWLRAGELAACGQCFSPIVTLPDFTRVSWPSFERHACKPVTVPDAPRTRPRRPVRPAVEAKRPQPAPEPPEDDDPEFGAPERAPEPIPHEEPVSDDRRRTTSEPSPTIAPRHPPRRGLRG